MTQSRLFIRLFPYSGNRTTGSEVINKEKRDLPFLYCAISSLATVRTQKTAGFSPYNFMVRTAANVTETTHYNCCNVKHENNCFVFAILARDMASMDHRNEGRM